MLGFEHLLGADNFRVYFLSPHPFPAAARATGYTHSTLCSDSQATAPSVSTWWLGASSMEGGKFTSFLEKRSKGMFYWYETEGKNKNLSHLLSTISSNVFIISYNLCFLPGSWCCISVASWSGQTVILLCPFDRWANWGWRRLIHSPRLQSQRHSQDLNPGRLLQDCTPDYCASNWGATLLIFFFFFP